MDKNLVAFLAVAETGNITAAAKRLHLTQPTLTKRLQQLEEDYGCAFFERLPRGVRVTPFGERLILYARRIRGDYVQSHEAVRAIRSDHLDVLRVGAGPLFHLRYLASAFEALRREFPATHLVLTADVNPRTLPALERGEIDIVFGTTEDAEIGERIDFQPIATVEHGLVMSASNPIAARRQVRARELRDVSWIIYSHNPDYAELVRAFFRREGLTPPNFVIETSSFSLGLQMAARDDYVMNIPIQLRPVIDPDRLRVVRTLPPIGRFPAGAFVRQSSKDIPIIRRLVELIRSAREDTSAIDVVRWTVK